MAASTAVRRQLAGIEIEQEMEASGEIAGGQAVAEQHQQQQEQQRHQDAAGGSQALADAAGDDGHRHQDEHRVPGQFLLRAGLQRVEGSLYGFGVGAVERAAAQQPDVVESPAGNHAVERQDHQPGRHAHPADHGPGARGSRFGRQEAHGTGRVAAGLPAQQDLGHHHRDAHQQDAGQVDQYEGPATVDAGDVGELPDVAQADGGAGGGQDESPAAGPAAVGAGIGRRHRHGPWSASLPGILAGAAGRG